MYFFGVGGESAYHLLLDSHHDLAPAMVFFILCVLFFFLISARLKYGLDHMFQT